MEYLSSWVAACTHVASQSMKRWLPIQWQTSPLFVDYAFDVPQIDPRFADDPTLLECFDKLLNNNMSGLAWLGAYLKTKDKNYRELCEVFKQHLYEVNESGSRYLLASDEEFPELLKTIPSPPSGLTMSGTSWPTTTSTHKKVAVVGSRRCSAEALMLAEDLGSILASAGIAVVSGGALGCDIAAHRGCMKITSQPVPAIVVFAGGLSKLYPKNNLHDFARLKERQACMMSEALWHQEPLPYHFLWRNRIISGLSDTTVLVEASAKSGALGTCRFALEQGRSLVVWRGMKDDVRAQGNRELINDGAASFSNIGEFLINLQESNQCYH